MDMYWPPGIFQVPWVFSACLPTSRQFFPLLLLRDNVWIEHLNSQGSLQPPALLGPSLSVQLQTSTSSGVRLACTPVHQPNAIAAKVPVHHLPTAQPDFNRIPQACSQRTFANQPNQSLASLLNPSTPCFLRVANHQDPSVLFYSFVYTNPLNLSPVRYFIHIHKCLYPVPLYENALCLTTPVPVWPVLFGFDQVPKIHKCIGTTSSYLSSSW